VLGHAETLLAAIRHLMTNENLCGSFLAPGSRHRSQASCGSPKAQSERQIALIVNAFRSGRCRFSPEAFFSQFTSQRERRDETLSTIHIQPKKISFGNKVRIDQSRRCKIMRGATSAWFGKHLNKT
jgi:hypothetical protein